MKQMYAITLKPGTYPPPLTAGMYVQNGSPQSELIFTPDIQAAQTWENYQDAYSYLDENLYGMADVVTVDSVPSQKLDVVKEPVQQKPDIVTVDLAQQKPDLVTVSVQDQKADVSPVYVQGRKKTRFWSLISLAITVVVGGGIFTTWQLTKACPVKSEKRVWGSCYRDLQARPLIIGVSGSPESDYSALAAYLRTKLGSSVEIDKNSPFEQIPGRIAGKDWDIVFTRSPMFSIAAEDKRYSGVAIMFPKQPFYYRAALYVRSDSPIQSIADIKPTTTIALGNPESAPTFYIPIYALYGKSLRVGTGYRPKDVVKMVKTGKVDVGAGRYTTVKDDPDLRIIYVSKSIPGATVYLSPSLSNIDRERVKKALLNAPAKIQAKANYGAGQIPKYDELRKITVKTEKILGCRGFNINSFDLKKTVDLFCKESLQDPNAVVGRVKEYKVLNEDNIELKVVTPKNQVYLVLVSKQILSQIPINPKDILDKSIQVKNVKPRSSKDGTWLVKITQLNQLALS